MDEKKNRVLLTIPCGDGRIEALTMMAVLNAVAAAGGCTNPGERIPTWGDTLRGPFMLCNNSNIRDARNKIAHYFKTRCTDCDRLIMLDSDIAFSVEDLSFLLEGDEDLVIASYSKKAVGEPPAEWGCGFARVHRRVFEKLDAWNNEDGSEALPRYFMHLNPGEQPEMAVDYFFDGAAPDGRWFGEDAGFWHWCALNDCTMRRETRTRLVHIGKFYYCYPDQTPGLIPISAGAQ
jgi:hypothetical protein